MAEFVQMIGIVVVGAIAAVGARLLLDVIRGGTQRVREIREEGGGLRQKWRGELDGGQRKPSTARAHGLHMVVRDGKLVYRKKSVIAREAA
ncbi:hypothetical protein GGQ61_001186 [Phenylobacterium haematophilum]|uniref:Uncharacterized protein n=1 Tax=Phenylobacterium haematophilum TaxID=98513 RepID=A0A839ZXL8_9CAUL|nr:hypothetical protein [Phenylobacterium haematophilum]MBB3890469.1 hypothetical protein [Phenylobacterium haematophilum]